MTNIDVPENIEDDDLIGRAIFSSKQAKKTIRPIVFIENINKTLSIDRFGFCSLEELSTIQDQNAKKEIRGKKPTFFLWLGKSKSLRCSKTK